jgi:xanthine dehydrogenase accessory factor
VTISAADVAELLMTTTEQGGSAASVVVVGGSVDGLAGRRLAIVIPTADGVPITHGGLGAPALDAAASELMTTALTDSRARDGLREIELDGRTVELYLELRRPVQELVVVGAGHVAQPMAHLGSLLGFKVTVLDDRPDFATRERFPDADRLIRADFSDPFASVPLHARSHILLVTRGHKYDYECLVRALRTDPPPAYIGMIGSRRRVRATYVQLIEEGIDRALIDRIHAPVGLDIGSETPEEIAVSVAAELVMLRRGGTGVPLKDVERVAERFFNDSRGDQ